MNNLFSQILFLLWAITTNYFSFILKRQKKLLTFWLDALLHTYCFQAIISIKNLTRELIPFTSFTNLTATFPYTLFQVLSVEQYVTTYGKQPGKGLKGKCYLCLLCFSVVAAKSVLSLPRGCLYSMDWNIEWNGGIKLNGMEQWSIVHSYN